MKKITKLCLRAALTTTIISGMLKLRELRKFRRRKLKIRREKIEKVEVQKKVGKYTMPDEKTNMKEHGYNGLMNTHMVKV